MLLIVFDDLRSVEFVRLPLKDSHIVGLLLEISLELQFNVNF